MELCLFYHPEDAQERARIRMAEVTDTVWHCFLPRVSTGQLYGYRMYGEYEPTDGYRYNEFKLLIDPYARAVAGLIRWSEVMFAYTLGAEDADLKNDERDNAAGLPKSVVVNDEFD